MMALNHSLLAAAGTCLLLGTNDWKVLSVVAIVAQLPDADLTTSYIGKLLYPISRRLEYHFPHRGITHSFVGSLIIAAVALPLILFWSLHTYYQAVITGYTLGWLGDTISKSGVACFWPHQARLVIPRNADLRIETSSPAEFWLSAIFTAILAFAISINSSGGILDSITQSLGQQEGVAELYLKARDTNLVYVKFEGYNLVTGKQIRGKFEIIDLDKQELLLQTPGGIVKTDEQLKTSSITTEKGQAISVQTRQLALDEQTPVEALQQLGRLPSRTYISGELRFKDAEDLRLHRRLELFATMKTIDGADVKSVHLQDASPRAIARQLGGYEASGSLFIRSVYVK